MATMYPFPAHAQIVGYDGISIRGPFEGISVAGAIFDDPVPARNGSTQPTRSRTPDDLNRISEYLVSSGRYRDNLLFVAGVNFGLRCGDLIQLKIGHLVHWNDERTLHNRSFAVIEEKTKKRRTLYVNGAVAEATALYIQQLASRSSRHEVDLNSYLFRSQSNRSTSDQPMSRRSVERLLKEIINDEMGLPIHASTPLPPEDFRLPHGHVRSGQKQSGRLPPTHLRATATPDTRCCTSASPRRRWKPPTTG